MQMNKRKLYIAGGIVKGFGTSNLQFDDSRTFVFCGGKVTVFYV